MPSRGLLTQATTKAHDRVWSCGRSAASIMPGGCSDLVRSPISVVVVSTGRSHCNRSRCDPRAKNDPSHKPPDRKNRSRMNKSRNVRGSCYGAGTHGEGGEGGGQQDQQGRRRALHKGTVRVRASHSWCPSRAPFQITLLDREGRKQTEFFLSHHSGLR